MRSSVREVNHDPGFTLIEVVVGLVLLASVCVGSLLAFAAHRDQAATARDKLTAVAIADDLLGTLCARRGGIPDRARGAVAGQPGLFWRTSIVGVARPVGVDAKVIRFEIVRRRDAKSLVSVDLVERLR